jgi:hypothetical protein
VFAHRADLVAQPPVSLLSIDRSPCQGCSLQVELLSIIGDSAQGVELPYGIWDAVREARGSFVALTTFPVPQRFDSTGRLLETIGARGQAPNEFANALTDVRRGRADSLIFFANPRGAYVFDGSGVFARKAILDSSFASLREVLSDGRIVVYRPAPDPRSRQVSPASRGSQFLLFAPTGEFLGRFGPVFPSYPMVTGAGRGGTIWTVRTIGPYEICQWSPEKGLLRTIVRDVPFAAGGFADFESYRQTPPPMVTAVREDSTGLLWVALRVARATWRDSLKIRSVEDTIWARDVRYDLLYDTIVEVLDPTSGELIATARIPAYLPQMPAPGYLLGNFLGDGLVRKAKLYAKLYAVRLVRPKGGP